MNKIEVIYFSHKGITRTPNEPPVTTKVRSFQIKAPSSDFPQYVKTVKAYVLAGMSFEDIAKAGEDLGHGVTRKETDAPLQPQSLRKAINGIEGDEHQIIAWQDRGETVSVTNQLQSPGGVTGQEIIPISQDLTTNVLEGIKVSNLNDNPYLQPLADLQKAA